jgi:ornithine cyclodeaminase
MTKIEFVYLSGPDIERLSLTNDDILNSVEAVLAAQGRGETQIEPRMHIRPDVGVNGHFNVLRGFIKPTMDAGVKVVGDFADNYKHGLPTALAVIALFDPLTGAPKAIVNGSKITDMRTGAMTAIGAKHLARANSRILGHVGTRGSSYWNVRLLAHLFQLDEIRVHSKRPESRRAFADKLQQDIGREVRVCDTWEQTFRGADILVEASRLIQPEPLFKTEWIEPGAFVVPYGTMSALEKNVVDAMDKFVVDDWGQCQPGMPFGAFRHHIDAGLITRDTLHAEMGEIVAGRKAGRERDDETIFFWHRGLSTTDLALARTAVDKAVALGIGQKLLFAEY